MHLVVDLTAACRNVLCENSEQCIDGRCHSTIDVDAGSPDAGTDSGMDAGTDASTDVGMDAGPPPMDASSTCRLDQRNLEGDFRCPRGCECNIQCSQWDDCRVFCDVGATCTVNCERGSDCQLYGGADSTLNFECNRSDRCFVRAEGNAVVDFECNNAECYANCIQAESCDVRYSHPNSHGFVRCGNRDNDCDITQCRGDDDECDDNILVCNRSCS